MKNLGHLNNSPYFICNNFYVDPEKVWKHPKAIVFDLVNNEHIKVYLARPESIIGNNLKVSKFTLDHSKPNRNIKILKDILVFTTALAKQLGYSLGIGFISPLKPNIKSDGRKTYLNVLHRYDNKNLMFSINESTSIDKVTLGLARIPKLDGDQDTVNFGPFAYRNVRNEINSSSENFPADQDVDHSFPTITIIKPLEIDLASRSIDKDRGNLIHIDFLKAPGGEVVCMPNIGTYEEDSSNNSYLVALEERERLKDEFPDISPTIFGINDLKATGQTIYKYLGSFGKTINCDLIQQLGIIQTIANPEFPGHRDEVVGVNIAGLQTILSLKKDDITQSPSVRHNKPVDLDTLLMLSLNPQDHVLQKLLELYGKNFAEALYEKGHLTDKVDVVIIDGEPGRILHESTSAQEAFIDAMKQHDIDLTGKLHLKPLDTDLRERIIESRVKQLAMAA